MQPATANTALRIALDGPIDLAASLAPFGRYGDDGMDRWDGRILARTVPLPSGSKVPYLARATGDVERPGLTLSLSATAKHHGQHVSEAVLRSFVTAHTELSLLCARDGSVAELCRRSRGVVPVLVADPFTALVRSISAQQVNLRWAATVRRRIAERYGTRHEIGNRNVYSLDPAPLASVSVEDLRALQLTTVKARSVIASAQAAVAGEVEARELSALSDDALIGHLTRLPGIGRWSAEWFLARTLGRPRVVAGDLGVRKAVGRLYDAGMPKEEEVRRLTAHWGDAAGVVQAMALHDLAVAVSGR